MTANADEDVLTMSLERRCRTLLLAYPSAYRRQRGEEMLGILLETNRGRAWPTPSDALALMLGGLRARGEQNQRLATVTNLRLAALLGCSLYLTTVAATYVSQGLWSQYPWQQLAVVALSWAAAAAPFLAGRRVVVALAGLAAAANVICFKSWQWDNGQALIATLVPLLLLIVLSRGATRPPRLWLWLPGLVVGTATIAQLLATPLWVVPSQLDGLWEVHTPLTVVLITVAIVWIPIDARLTAGVAAAYFAVQFLTNFELAGFISRVPSIGHLRAATLLQVHDGVVTHLVVAGPASQTWFAGSPLDWGLTWSSGWIWLVPAVPLAALALWRVRRQAVL